MSTIAKPPGRVLISAEQFGRMQAAGVFEGQHVELLDGELYEVTKNPSHNYAVDALAEALRSLLPRDVYRGSVRRSRSSPGATGGPSLTSRWCEGPNSATRSGTRGRLTSC
ncbi:MAG: hypothetical protein ABSH35_05540 [Isosphaeraceae bacterium]